MPQRVLSPDQYGSTFWGEKCSSTFLQATNPSRSRRVRDARKSASERIHCCFCSSPRQANSAILVNLDQKTSVRTQKKKCYFSFPFCMRTTHSASLVFRLSFCLLFALSTLGIAIKGATSFSSPRKMEKKFLQPTTSQKCRAKHLAVCRSLFWPIFFYY